VRALRVLLLAAATAWVTGTVLLIGMVVVMFRHAPSHDHPIGAFEFVDHDSAGIVFGHMLGVWGDVVLRALLPAVVIGAAGCLFAALRSRRTRAAAFWLIGIVVVAALQAWTCSATDRTNSTFAELRKNRGDDALNRQFNAVHRQSTTATGLTALTVLILGVSAAAGLIRRDSASAGPDAG
jgi:hypothetical protein